MSQSSTQCLKCGVALADDVPERPPVPCPNCGETLRKHSAHIEDHLHFHDSIRGKAKRSWLRSADKLRWDSFAGYVLSKSLQRLVKVERTIDRDAGTYSERVTDPKSGNIIHECHEALSAHRGHGSAKVKP